MLLHTAALYFKYFEVIQFSQNYFSQNNHIYNFLVIMKKIKSKKFELFLLKQTGLQ